MSAATLIDHLRFRARLDPGGIAIRRMKGQVTHLELFRLVKLYALKLREAGVRPGQIVVTATADKALDWVATLALLHEGAISCSNHGYAPWSGGVDYDWVLADRARHPFDPARTLPLKAEAGPTPRGLEPQGNFAGDDTIRLVLTSGTTGTRKLVGLTQKQSIDRAVTGMWVREGWSSLSMLGLSTAADFNACVSGLLLGTPLYVAKGPAETVDLVAGSGVEALFGSPDQIASIVRELERRDTRLDCVKVVRMAGAAAGRALLERIHQRVTRNVVALYGSTESFSMAVFKPTAGSAPAMVGHVHVDSEVEVVDDTGQPLPAGQEGVLRVRTPFMVDGYFRNPEETALRFRGGWFYPGDRGLFDGRGRLVLAGRESEVLNRGGVKLNPVLIDEFLASLPGIEDAAVFRFEDSGGAEHLGVAVVSPGKVEPAPVIEEVQRKFGPRARPALVVRLKQVPRNQMGKVMRAEIGKHVARLRSAQAAAGPGDSVPPPT